ncbi:MAG: hypothetical protein RLZZ427_1433 [Pseudomonadota bacterium]|jgi:phosphatidate cytidylyltransferase
MADAEVKAKSSDLPVRTASAVVMVAVAGSALWLGGWLWLALVAAIALGVLWEWWGLVRGFAPHALARLRWMAAGLLYVGVAALRLAALRVVPGPGRGMVLPIVLAVIATDIGAYFAGRTFGGPKIAPKVSPSKTWSGLIGGILGAGVSLILSLGGQCDAFDAPRPLWSECLLRTVSSHDLWTLLIAGAVIAIVAQAGDFFESWMKRRAGVKDSGHLIPGHGGLFDRVDGLLAVCFVLGLMSLVPFIVNP